MSTTGENIVISLNIPNYKYFTEPIVKEAGIAFRQTGHRLEDALPYINSSVGVWITNLEDVFTPTNDHAYQMIRMHPENKWGSLILKHLVDEQQVKLAQLQLVTDMGVKTYQQQILNNSGIFVEEEQITQIHAGSDQMVLVNLVQARLGLV